MPTTSEDQWRANRRSVMGAIGVGVLGGLAGCTASAPLGASPDDGTDPEEQEDDANGEETDAPLTDHPFTAPPAIVDLDEQGFEATLRTTPARHELVTADAAGGPVVLPEVWAFRADDREPSVPGPTFRVSEGETVELTYVNDHSHQHTVHVHAVSASWPDDGASSTGGQSPIDPGDARTYTLEADVPGTHLYHCHVQTDTHMDMGMYGIFHVVPEDREPVDREYFLTLRDWDTRLHELQAGGDARYRTVDRDPDAFTINGRSAPSTFHPEDGLPIVVGAGETVRVHLVNAGYQSHPFHTHRHRFEVVAKDGSPIPDVARYDRDVVNVGPAERYSIEFEADADPGIYPAHCHKVDHVTTEGSYPGGMATAIVYEDVMDTEEFAGVMEQAGYDA